MVRWYTLSTIKLIDISLFWCLSLMLLLILSCTSIQLVTIYIFVKIICKLSSSIDSFIQHESALINTLYTKTDIYFIFVSCYWSWHVLKIKQLVFIYHVKAWVTFVETVGSLQILYCMDNYRCYIDMYQTIFCLDKHNIKSFYYFTPLQFMN